MTLTPRFTNRAVRELFEAHEIDLMNLPPDAITDPDTRLKITQAGHPADVADAVAEACDNITPGEHIELLSVTLRRDLVPASIREATAKAAAASKSEAA